MQLPFVYKSGVREAVNVYAGGRVIEQLETAIVQDKRGLKWYNHITKVDGKPARVSDSKG